MTNNIKNTMLISTIGIGAIATYSMYKRSKNARRPLNRARNMISRTTANMF